MQGFQTFKATGVVVATNQVVRTNASLQPGGVNETINIVAEAQVLNTDSATVSETIGERAIKELPIPGRNVFNLAARRLASSRGLSSDQGLSFRGAGQREIQNSLSLDGINASANLLAATSMRPIADAVTEVQVQTGSTSAEYGSYLGVHVNVVTKSGTNDYHGALAHYYQGDKLDARGYFENRANPKNPRKRNQFSYEFDGPLSIPGLYNGHDKTFFMAAYEGVRSEATLASFGTVPTALMRNGNFSEFNGAIKNPLTGQNFAGNVIPQSMISPVAQKLLNYYPAPNLPGTASNLQTTRTEVRDNDQVLFRVDQNLGNKIRLNVRYNWLDTFDDNLETIPASSTTQPRNNKNTLVSYTHTLSPNLHNDFRIGYHRLQFDTLGYFNVNGIASAGTDARHPWLRRRYALRQPGHSDDQRHQLHHARRRRHELVSVRYDLPGVERARLDQGSAQHPHRLRPAPDDHRPPRRRTIRAARSRSPAISPATRSPTSCSACRARCVTRSIRSRATSAAGATASSSTTCGRRRRNLTLSLGLRYEMNTPVQTYVGLATMLAEDGLTLIPNPSTLPQPGFEFTEANKKDFAPRLGATYRLGDKTVVRAGFGIYYNPNQMNSYTFLTNNPASVAGNHLLHRCREPESVVRGADGSRRARRSHRRDFADAQAAERPEASVELRPPARARGGHGVRPPVRRLAHEESRSQLLQQHADARRGRGRSAPSDVALSHPPHHHERPDRRLRRGQLHRAQADEQRPAGRRALHLVEDARHRRRTRTAAVRRWTTTIRCSTTVRRTGTFRTASWPATSTTFRSGRPRRMDSCATSRLAGRSPV